MHDPDAPEYRPANALTWDPAHNWRTANSNNSASRAKERERVRLMGRKSAELYAAAVALTDSE